MDYYDSKAIAIDSAIKGLTIGFIVGICGANCVLIFRTVQKGGFFYTPKSLTLISLAIGDIFVALFPLIVKARTLFEGSDFEYSCSTFLSSGLYFNFLIHFVYAMGLIVLAVELVYRYRKQPTAENNKENILKTLAWSAFPWMLPLVVDLPLMFAGSDMDLSSCLKHLTTDRIRTMYGVSVILPAIVAAIACFIIMCIRLSPAYYTSPAISYQVTEQVTSINPQNTQIINQHHVLNSSMGYAQYPVGNSVVVHQFPVDNTGPQQHAGIPDLSKPDPTLTGQGFATPNTQYSVQQYPVQQQVPPQYPVQQYPIQQYPVQQQVLPQYPIQQYPPAQYTAQSYSTQPNVVIAAPFYPMQPQMPAATALPDPGRERKILLLVSIIHFICVIPFAVYTLGSSVGGYEATYTDAIISLILSWLSVFRSLVTPCVFAILNK